MTAKIKRLFTAELEQKEIHPRRQRNIKQSSLIRYLNPTFGGQIQIIPFMKTSVQSAFALLGTILNFVSFPFQVIR